MKEIEYILSRIKFNRPDSEFAKLSYAEAMKKIEEDRKREEEEEIEKINSSAHGSNDGLFEEIMDIMQDKGSSNVSKTKRETYYSYEGRIDIVESARTGGVSGIIIGTGGTLQPYMQLDVEDIKNLFRAVGKYIEQKNQNQM